jgi:quinol monooxygenase YgiN
MALTVKWIRCRVALEKRAAFSDAQARWAPVADAVGFLGQHGGFADDGEACVVAMWSDLTAVETFMTCLHDPLAARTGQVATYDSCETTLLHGVLRMTPAPARQGSGRLLRIAECQVRDERRAHFVDAQVGVWLPAMTSADGMLGGVFAVSARDPSSFLVVSAWRDEDSYATYAREQVPELRARAAVEHDVVTLRGRRVLLEPTWRVAPSFGGGEPMWRSS